MERNTCCVFAVSVSWKRIWMIFSFVLLETRKRLFPLLLTAPPVSWFWIVGCSCHIVGKKLFSNLFDIHEVSPRVISLVDAKTYTSNHAGTLIVQPVKGGKTLHITDVTDVPEINDWFIFISQLVKKNLISIFKGDICQIRSKNDVLITVKHTGGLYRVETFKVVADSLLCSDSKPSPTEKNNKTIMDIHSKLGHGLWSCFIESYC